MSESMHRSPGLSNSPICSPPLAFMKLTKSRRDLNSKLKSISYSHTHPDSRRRPPVPQPFPYQYTKAVSVGRRFALRMDDGDSLAVPDHVRSQERVHGFG